MDIYVYSDESGVFDRAHNSWFVFGGVMFLSKDAKDIAARKYITAEKVIRQRVSFRREQEVKATTVSNQNKGKLYRSLNQLEKFGVVVDEQNVLPQIFTDKKSKQRYLDYVYKIGIKRKFQCLIRDGKIEPTHVENIYFFVDEHTTATNGRYELREALEQELKTGTYNMDYSLFFPPIFTNLKSVQLTFCDSKTTTLVRAADIIANRLYYCVTHKAFQECPNGNFLATFLPHEWQLSIKPARVAGNNRTVEEN